jgi:hypothetical protein
MKWLSVELTCLFTIYLNKKIGIIGELISLLYNPYFIILMGLLLAFSKWLSLSNLWREDK